MNFSVASWRSPRPEATRFLANGFAHFVTKDAIQTRRPCEAVGLMFCRKATTEAYKRDPISEHLLFSMPMWHTEVSNAVNAYQELISIVSGNPSQILQTLIKRINGCHKSRHRQRLVAETMPHLEA